jgi:ribosomal protein S1
MAVNTDDSPHDEGGEQRIEPEPAEVVPPPRPVHPTAPPIAPPPTVAPRVVDVTIRSLEDGRIVVALADGRTGVIEPRDQVEGEAAAPGSTIRAAVLAREDAKGRVLLSRRWAKQAEAWQQVEAAHEGREPIEGEVRKTTKGGFVVDLCGLRAFLPASQSGIERGDSPDQLLGQTVKVQVMELDRARDRLLVSRRECLRRERRDAENLFLSTLRPGAHVSGTVLALLDFGAQIDIGHGVRALVHRNELSWSRVHDVGDHVTVGQVVEARVVEVNEAKRRINLSIRQLVPDPLDSVELGAIVEAEIVSVVDYGAFARLVDSGAEGLIHASHLSEQRNLRPDQIVMTGERVMVKVIQRDPVQRRLGLSVTEALLAT